MINNLRDTFPDYIGKSIIAYSVKVQDDHKVHAGEAQFFVGSEDMEGDMHLDKKHVSEGSEVEMDDDVDVGNGIGQEHVRRIGGQIADRVADRIGGEL